MKLQLLQHQMVGRLLAVTALLLVYATSLINAAQDRTSQVSSTWTSCISFHFTLPRERGERERERERERELFSVTNTIVQYVTCASCVSPKVYIPRGLYSTAQYTNWLRPSINDSLYKVTSHPFIFTVSIIITIIIIIIIFDWSLLQLAMVGGSLV
jgi:hypothetical protein